VTPAQTGAGAENPAAPVPAIPAWVGPSGHCDSGMAGGAGMGSTSTKLCPMAMEHSATLLSA